VLGREVEVLATVTLKVTVVWNGTPYSLIDSKEASDNGGTSTFRTEEYLL
jgi:hypothetical protein